MNRIKQTLLILAAAVAVAMPAQAKVFSFGPRVGVGINEMKFDSSVASSDNLTGFTAGLEAEITVPVIGLGFDISAMYVRRSAQFMENNNIVDTQRDYIDIPLNLKYKISLPAIGSLVTPYVFTGPDFAFLTSKKAINEAWENKSVNVAWNFGAGVQLFSHLQVGASYGIGITKAAEKIGVTTSGETIEGKNNYWTVTAAWLF